MFSAYPSIGFAATAKTGKQMQFRMLQFYDIDDGGHELTYQQVAQRFGLKRTDVTNYLAYARREFRKIVLEQLREMTAKRRRVPAGSADTTRNEADECDCILDFAMTFTRCLP